MSLFLLPGLVFLVAPEDRLDPGLQLQDIEGLGEIVVGPVFQSEDLVHVAALGRQHDHRHLGELPDGLADLKAVQLREHHVQKDHVVLLLPDLLQGLLAVIGAVNLHAVLLQ